MKTFTIWRKNGQHMAEVEANTPDEALLIMHLDDGHVGQCYLDERFRLRFASDEAKSNLGGFETFNVNDIHAAR